MVGLGLSSNSAARGAAPDTVCETTYDRTHPDAARGQAGQMGERVKGKPGYARNFLLPVGKAIRATKSNLEKFEGERVQLEAQNLKRREEAERVSERMEGLSVILIRSAGESGNLYGSVSARDIADGCKAQGLNVTAPRCCWSSRSSCWA
jgi:ribosomal protein L9